MADESEDHEKNKGLYITMVAYYVGLLLLAVYGAMKSSAAKVAATESGGSVAKAHFGQGFNVGLLILTTFSSLFSGYTVTGTPQEAAGQGFFALRWMSAVSTIGCGMLIYYPRLRRLSQARSYLSPNDFVADRYRSVPVKLLTCFCMCLPQILYLSIQVKSFASLLRVLTLGFIPELAGYIIFGVTVIGMEISGGMHSVVLSDAIQAMLMIIGFLLLPMIIFHHYGFLGEMAPADCPSLLYVNRTTNIPDFQAPPICDAQMLAACTNSSLNCTAVGCIKAAQPAFYKYPSTEASYKYVFFIFNMLSFPLNPHMIQRTYMASADGALRIVVFVIIIAPMLAFPPGILCGVVKATFHESWPAIQRSGSAFAAMSLELQKIGGLLEYGVVSVLTCSALAAIMSTSDSLIIGMSNTFSVDFVQGLLLPEITDTALVHVSSALSVVEVVIASFIATNISVSNFGQMLTMQNGILMQIIPAYGLGLFFDVKSSSICAGILGGIFALVCCETIYNPLAPIPGPNVAFGLNLFVVMLIHNLPRPMPQSVTGDGLTARFGERLGMRKIEEIMEGTKEPNYTLVGIAIALNLAGTPWYATPGAPQEVIFWGLPACYGSTVMYFFISTALLIAAVASWRPAPPREVKPRGTTLGSALGDYRKESEMTAPLDRVSEHTEPTSFNTRGSLADACDADVS